ncbi:helix-turn-helix domain-containing protein [Sphaerisporangium sp. B11E5]|uniref:helix-turn-helix domain-containing protein n=1 Tax=Sphaerisporangium sp. B11E5 TaxID=3153563 RepID=UPI00325CB6F2
MTSTTTAAGPISPEGLALLRRLRVDYRDHPAYPDLLTLSAIALALNACATTANGNELVIEKALTGQSTLTTQDVANITGLTDRAVRLACQQQRLHATRHGRDWHITHLALAEWITTRAA